MSDRPIDKLMETSMQKLKEMVDVNTIVGNPVETPDGSIIIPISRVGFGFAAGGSEFGKNSETETAKFGGGSGGGVSISPVAFMVVGQGQVKLMPVSQQYSAIDKIIDMVPGVVDKVNGFIGSAKEKHDKKKAEKASKSEPVTVETVFEE